MSTTQGIRLDDSTSRRLKRLAKERDRTPHWLMREAINRYLESEERYEQEKQEDAARWEQYVLTGRAIPASEMNQWLDELARLRPRSRIEPRRLLQLKLLQYLVAPSPLNHRHLAGFPGRCVIGELGEVVFNQFRQAPAVHGLWIRVCEFLHSHCRPGIRAGAPGGEEEEHQGSGTDVMNVHAHLP